MKQPTLAGFEKYGKTTRRAQFLADMDRVIPWTELAAAVQTAYPKVERARWPTTDSAGADAADLLPAAVVQPVGSGGGGSALRLGGDARFAGIDLGVEGAPDETTVCKFRHLLERNKLGKVLLSAVNEHLHRSGIKIAKGTIVDATIIGAPSSTKNQDGQRDPEMHQTAKGKQWYFGMKAHVGVDSHTKLIHTVLVSAANVHDREALPHLLHGQETRVWGDQGYQGQTAVIRQRSPQAKDFTNKRYRYHGQINAVEKAKNRNKSRVRAKVERVNGNPSRASRS